MIRKFLGIGSLLFFCLNAVASEQSMSVGGSVGLPNLLAFDLRYVGFEEVEFGLSFGSLPLDSLLEGKIPLDAQDVDLQQPDPYKVYPSAGFALTGYTPYLRYYPWKSKFFFQLGYSIWRFRANLRGDLRNETSGVTSYGVVSGTLSIDQPVVTPGIGWRWKILNSFQLDVGVGVSVLQETQAAVNIGGSLNNILTVLPAAQVEFDNAVTEIQNQLDSGVGSFRNSIPVLPSVFLGLGFAF